MTAADIKLAVSSSSDCCRYQVGSSSDCWECHLKSQSGRVGSGRVKIYDLECTCDHILDASAISESICQWHVPVVDPRMPA